MLLGSRGYTQLGSCRNEPQASNRVTAGRERGTTRVQRPTPLIGFRPSGRAGRRCGSLHPGPFSNLHFSALRLLPRVLIGLS